MINKLDLHCGGLNVSQQTEGWNIVKEKQDKGDTKIITSLITTPEGQLTQEFSIHRMNNATFMYMKH